MSKRFGRNQRRRAREALASEQSRVTDLERARAMDAGLLAQYHRDLDDIRGRLAGIANLVGHQAVIAGEPTHLSGGFDGMRFFPTKEFSSYEMRAPMLEPVTYEVLRLLEVDAIRDHFSRHLHFRVQLAGSRAAYGITECALLEMPVEAVERVLLPQIARDLARVLAQGIKGLGK